MYSYNGTSAPSYRALTTLYRTKFYESVAAGEIKPLIAPYNFLGLFLLIGYLCIPHVGRPWLYATRWLVLATIITLEVKKILETSSISWGTGFHVGLCSAWYIIWSMTLLVWTNPQLDARRVERRLGRNIARDENGSPKQKNVMAYNQLSNTNDGLKVRLQQKGHTKDTPEGMGKKDERPLTATEYFWQPYPKDSFRDRLGWVLDLVLNFRFPGWNWEISTNPGLPAKVKASLGEAIDLKAMELKSRVGIRLFISRSQFLMALLHRFILAYLLLDVLKVTMTKDPYFLIGPNDYPLPTHLAPLSPIILDIYRKLFSLFGIIVALEFISLYVPFLLCILLGPSILGVRGEAWLYPTTWGSLENVFAKGLVGLWGGLWHQTFRFGFLAPSNYLIHQGLLSPRSRTIKLISLLAAFTASGVIHACASITQFPRTVPYNQFLFFLLQPLGILLQIGFCTFFESRISKLTPQIRRAGNFAYTSTWMYITCPLLIDDFARGGLWLYEPLPISPLRWLGLGEETDQRWWVWDHFGMWYAGGRRWWECGWLI